MVLASLAQKQVEYFNSKINQHSISLEVASVAYTYVHQFAPKLRLGARVQIGVATFFIPIQPLKIRPAMWDFFNFQLLYRAKAAKSVYIDIGLLASYPSYFGDWQLVNTFGVVGSAYYQYKKLHVGFSLQVRGFSRWYYDSYTTEGDPLSSSTKTTFLPVFSPLIIGLSF